MEGKREALVKEALESSTGSTLQDKLAELDLTKPRPYGTFPAVRSNYFLPDHSILLAYYFIIHGIHKYRLLTDCHSEIFLNGQKLCCCDSQDTILLIGLGYRLPNYMGDFSFSQCRFLYSTLLVGT